MGTDERETTARGSSSPTITTMMIQRSVWDTTTTTTTTTTTITPMEISAELYYISTGCTVNNAGIYINAALEPNRAGPSLVGKWQRWMGGNLLTKNLVLPGPLHQRYEGLGTGVVMVDPITGLLEHLPALPATVFNKLRCLGFVPGDPVRRNTVLVFASTPQHTVSGTKGTAFMYIGNHRRQWMAIPKCTVRHVSAQYPYEGAFFCGRMCWLLRPSPLFCFGRSCVLRFHPERSIWGAADAEFLPPADPEVQLPRLVGVGSCLRLLLVGCDPRVPEFLVWQAQGLLLDGYRPFTWLWISSSGPLGHHVALEGLVLHNPGLRFRRFFAADENAEVVCIEDLRMHRCCAFNVAAKQWSFSHNLHASALHLHRLSRCFCHVRHPFICAQFASSITELTGNGNCSSPMIQ